MTALTVAKLRREFSYHGTVFPDPGENLSIEQVRDHLSMVHPDIATAEIEEREVRKDGTVVYEVRRKVGHKG